MKRLRIRYRGWGEDWPLGQLAENNHEVLFQYSEEALRLGLELSPLNLPLKSDAYGEFPQHLMYLPGLIADALPDGWGLLLMDRFFRRQGLETASISPLDRLALLGDRALGALTFEPMTPLDFEDTGASLLDLAAEITEVYEGKDGEVLKHLLLVGGSPHGARPKALIGYCPSRGTVRTLADKTHLPYLVKFPAQTEHKEVCAIEHVYCETARACGIDVPDTQYFDLDRSHAAFGIQRFDLEGDLRVPMHTLAGLLHADFRVPAVGYSTLLRATQAFTGDQREVLKAYERAVYNVIFNNRDDHSKNFAFLLGRDQHWRLAPAYDLTFSAGPRGEHQMDVLGEARRISGTHLHELAKMGDLPARAASASLERMLQQIEGFEERLNNAPVRRATVRSILGTVRKNAAALRTDG